MRNITFKKVAKINNFFIYHFNKINEFAKITNNKFKNISSFNRYLIFLITISFLYLFFLSIPSLYKKGALQSKLNKMINEEYNINVSLSSKIAYNILPKPHFTIENTKLYTNELSAGNFNTKKECILDYITNEFGSHGARYTDIIKFAYYLGAHNAPKYTSESRGYYAMAFSTRYGGHLIQGGKDFLVKGINKDGKERYFTHSNVNKFTDYYKRIS